MYHGYWQSCILHIYYDTQNIEDEDFKSVKTILENCAQKFKIESYLELTEHTSSKSDGVFIVNQLRQVKCVTHALNKIRSLFLSQGLHWVFYIDDDEIIFSKDTTILQAAEDNMRYDTWSMRTWEARITASNYSSIFEADMFETDVCNFISYTNGKACAKLLQDTVLLGPHCFESGKNTCAQIFVENIVVLHYNCTTFEKWTDKYKLYAQKPKNESVFLFDSMSDLLHRTNTTDSLKRAYYENKIWGGVKCGVVQTTTTQNLVSLRDHLLNLYDLYVSSYPSTVSTQSNETNVLQRVEYLANVPMQVETHPLPDSHF
jgi:hypothetical protein